MVNSDSSSKAEATWRVHLRGHLLLFEARPAVAPSSLLGGRLLLAAAFMEMVRLAAVSWLRPSVPLWVLLPALLGVALIVVAGTAGRELPQLGLRRWRDWSRTEKSYFVQVLCLANLAFPIVLAGPLGKRVAESGLALGIGLVFLPCLSFGFYQELVYRGMLQLALVRRWGAPIGILAANVLYTVGPLHFYYFASPASLAIPMFAGIFAIGLFFGLLYHRSGNLWMGAVFHAIGNAYMLSAFE